MRFTSYKDKVKAVLKDCKHEACVKVGTLAVAEVQSVTPVGVGTAEPGNLRRSIASEPMQNDEGVIIGVTAAAPYGLVVEKGSSRQKANPYLEPGTNAAIPKIKNVINEIYRNRLGGG